MAMTKARQQEILQHKIDFYTEKYDNFITYGISVRKINKVDARKDTFMAAKAIVDAS